MADGQQNLIKLHDNLIKEGYELPEFKQFEMDMSDSNKRVKLHDSLVKDGFELPDVNTFSNDIGFGVKKKEPTQKIGSFLGGAASGLNGNSQSKLQEQNEPLIPNARDLAAKNIIKSDNLGKINQQKEIILKTPKEGIKKEIHKVKNWEKSPLNPTASVINLPETLDRSELKVFDSVGGKLQTPEKQKELVEQIKKEGDNNISFQSQLATDFMKDEGMAEGSDVTQFYQIKKDEIDNEKKKMGEELASFYENASPVDLARIGENGIADFEKRADELNKKQYQLDKYASVLTNIQAVNNTPIPNIHDDDSMGKYFREIGAKVNSLTDKNAISKRIEDETNKGFGVASELKEVRAFQDELTGINAANTDLQRKLQSGEISKEDFDTQSNYLEKYSNNLLNKHPGAKMQIYKKALGQLVEDSRKKTDELGTVTGVWNDVFSSKPTDSEVKSAIKKLKERGATFSQKEEEYFIKHPSEISGTAAIPSFFGKTSEGFVKMTNPLNRLFGIENKEQQDLGLQAMEQSFSKTPNQTFEQPNTIIDVNKGNTFLKEINNPRAGQINHTIAGYGDAIASAAATITNFVIGNKGFGAIGKSLGLGENAANIAKNIATNTLLTHDDALKTAETFTKNKAEQEAYALITGTLGGLLFAKLDPEGLVKKAFLKPSEETIKSFLTAAKKDGIAAMKPETVGNFISTTIKKAVGNNLSATTLITADQVKNIAVQSLFNPESTKDYDLIKETKKNLLHNAIAFAPISLLGGRSAAKEDISKREALRINMFEASKNIPEFQRAIGEMVDKGEISAKDAQYKIEVITELAKIRESKDLPKDLIPDQQAKYATNLLQEKQIEKELEDVTDKVQLNTKKEEIKELHDERTAIIKGKEEEYNKIEDLYNRAYEKGTHNNTLEAGTKTEGIEYLKDQALTAPNSFKNQSKGDIELTTDLISLNSKEDIKSEIKSWGDKIKEDTPKSEVETIEKHIDLLKQGLEKQKPKKIIEDTEQSIPTQEGKVEQPSNKQEVVEPKLEEKTFTQNALNRADAKNIFAQVRVIEKPTSAEQVALGYIANGGKVSEDAINEISGTSKRASLNTGARELKSSEAKARDYSDKKSETLDEIAHNLWELNNQEISERDIKDALMDVINTNNTRLEAGKKYLERYSPEYNEKKQQEKFYQEHIKEITEEEKAINEWLNNENELAIESMSDINYVTKLIEKYESEIKGENQQSPTKTENSTNKGTGSNTGNEKTGETKELDKLANNVPDSGKIAEYMSKDTIEKYTGEMPTNDQSRGIQELEIALNHGEKIIEKAKEIYGKDYAEKTLTYIDNSTSGVSNKALMYVSLENALGREKLADPARAAELTKQQALVYKRSQAFARENSLALNYQRLRKIAQVGYDISKVTDNFFSAEELVGKKNLENAIESDAETIQKEYEAQETGGFSAEIKKQITEGVSKEIQKIYDKLPKDKKSAADKAILALENIQSKLRSKTYDATIGIPIAIIDTGISTIKLAIKAGVKIADAIELGIEKIKELYGKEWNKEDEFRKDVTAGFGKIKSNTDIIKEALIEKGFSTEITIKGRNKIILDWKKLVGEAGTVEKIKENVESVLKNKGKSDKEISEISKELIDEYVDLRYSVIEKAQNELAKRNKETISADQKSAAKKLAELYTYGLFEEKAPEFEITLNKALGAKVSEAGYNEAKVIAKGLETIYTASFNGIKLNDVSAKAAIEKLEDRLRILLFRESKAQGNNNLKLANIVRNYFEIQQTMLLNNLKQAFENPLSGLQQEAIDKITSITSGENTKLLAGQRRKLMKDVYKDMMLNGGIGYGKVESAFVNRQHIDDYVNKLSDNKLYHGIASVVTGKATLNTMDAMFKASITEKKFAGNLIKILTHETNPNRMGKEDALKFVSEKLTGQTFKDAQVTAKQIIEKINTDAGSELISLNPHQVDRFANDIVKAALEMGGKINTEQITAAYNAAYKAAGLGLGHTANNIVSSMITGYSAKVEGDITQAIKNKEWDRAAMLTYKSVLFRNVLNPFVGGGTNWLVLKLEKTGLGLFTGLAYKIGSKGAIDVNSELGMKRLEERLYNQATVKDNFMRGIVGGATSLLTYGAFMGVANLDEYRKWRGNNRWAARYLDTITPEYLLAHMAINDKKIERYVSSSFNKNDAFDASNKVIKAGVYAVKGDRQKAWGALGEAIGSKINAPLPWRLVKDGQVIYQGIIGQDPYHGDYKPSEGFMSGVLQGGVIEWLGGRKKVDEFEYKAQKKIEEENKRKLMTKEEREAEMKEKSEKAKKTKEKKRLIEEAKRRILNK